MNIILLEPPEVAEQGRVVLSGARALHIRNVLHARPGDVFRMGVIDGPLGTGEVVEVGDDTIELRCTLNEEAPPRPPVDLLLALPRPKVMKRLWAQLAALGVGRIILTNAWKVERNYFDTHVLDAGFYRPLLIEGLQQARDTRLPEVSIHKQFKVLVNEHLAALVPDAIRVVADPRGERSIRETVNSGSRRVLLAVGPEGGWTDYEIALLQQHAFATIALGRRTLRADTACVALLALVHEALQDS